MTRQERREAEAAIYGLSIPPTMSPTQLSHDEIERMRAIVAQHDNAGDRKPGMVKEFDLNNPPQPSYRFQEFPKMVYNHQARTARTVNSKAEEKAALSAGFELKPYSPVAAPAIEEPEAEEIRRLDEIARQKKLEKAG